MQEAQWSLYNIMRFIVGDAPGMIFGDTGTGKSMFVRSVIQSAVRQGVKVAMCDTEGNYMQDDIDWLKANAQYSYAGTLQEIIAWVKKLSKDYDLIVLDSIGGPAYGQYVEADRKRAGEILKKIAGVAFTVQQYCQANGAMAIVVNQPTSDFAGGDYGSGPFGGKSEFYFKEVLRTIALQSQDGWGMSRLEMFKSRHTKAGAVVATIGISDDKVAIKFQPYRGRRPDGYPQKDCVIPNSVAGAPQKKEKQEPEQETPEDSGENIPEETQEPADPAEETTEIPIEEESSENSGESFDSGGELSGVLDEITKLVEEKEVSPIQFKAIMKSKSVAVESVDQVSDLDTANAVKVVLEGFGKQKD